MPVLEPAATVVAEPGRAAHSLGHTMPVGHFAGSDDVEPRSEERLGFVASRVPASDDLDHGLKFHTSANVCEHPTKPLGERNEQRGDIIRKERETANPDTVITH